MGKVDFYKNVNGVELAKYIDLTSARITQLTDKGVLKKKPDGNYDLKTNVVSYIHHLRKSSVDYVNLTMSAAEAKQRKMIAEAILAEIEVNLQKNRILNVADVKPQWEKMVTAFKTKMLALAAKVAPLLFQKPTIAEINGILQRQVIEALNELANEDIEIVESKESGSENGTSSTS